MALFPYLRNCRPRGCSADAARAGRSDRPTPRGRSTGSSGSTSRGCARTGSTRAKAALEASDLGALLLFDPNNIRYVTSTHIGEWARDKNARFALLPREGRPDPLGLRLGGPAPPAVRALAAAGELAGRRGADARRDARRDRHAGPARRADRERAARARPRGRAARHRHDRHAHARGAPARRHPGHRRLAGRARGAQDQDGRGDRAARPVRRARRRRLRGDLPDAAARRLRAPDRRAGAPAAVRDGLRAGGGDQRRLGRPLQPASARVLATGCCARATRRSSTSSTRSWATGRATTARSTSAA